MRFHWRFSYRGSSLSQACRGLPRSAAFRELLPEKRVRRDRAHSIPKPVPSGTVQTISLLEPCPAVSRRAGFSPRGCDRIAAARRYRVGPISPVRDQATTGDEEAVRGQLPAIECLAASGMIDYRDECRQPARRHDEAAFGVRCRDRALDLRRIAHASTAQLDSTTAPRTGFRRLTATSRYRRSRRTAAQRGAQPSWQLPPFTTDAVSNRKTNQWPSRRRARLSTKPAPTRSATFADAVGIIRSPCSSPARFGLALARMTSRASADRFRRVLADPLRRRRRPSDRRSGRIRVEQVQPSPAAPAGCPGVGLTFAGRLC